MQFVSEIEHRRKAESEEKFGVKRNHEKKKKGEKNKETLILGKKNYFFVKIL